METRKNGDWRRPHTTIAVPYASQRVPVPVFPFPSCFGRFAHVRFEIRLAAA